MRIARLRRSVLGLLSVAIAIGCTKNGAQSIQSPTRAQGACGQARAAADPDAKNLSAEEELDALMAGDSKSGLCTDVARIAVPPLVVLGDADKAWLGEAAAEVVAARLSQAEGTSVLERAELERIIEELEKTRGEAGDSVVGAGKLLGARLLVTGKMFPNGDGSFKGVIKAVATETGVWQPAIEFDAPLDSWSNAVATAAERLRKSLGTTVTAISGPPPLDAKRLETAARAWSSSTKARRWMRSRSTPGPWTAPAARGVTRRST